MARSSAASRESARAGLLGGPPGGPTCSVTHPIIHKTQSCSIEGRHGYAGEIRCNFVAMRILMVASEAVPFARTGGLADVVGALSRALVRLGHDVDVIM